VQLEIPAFIQTGVAADVATGFDGDPANQKIERNIAAVTVEDWRQPGDPTTRF
jgi:hypothetical protein